MGLDRYTHPLPVPHAHHFLGRLDRVTREQTEFALGLYRDHEGVRYVLDQVNLPPSAERVAIAIDDVREGPFVIVTRDGRFVTCLGKGMHQDHPVVPRPQVDALLAKVADKRARREMARRELRPDEDEDDVFQRIATRGSRLAREDFVAVSAFEPMLGAEAWELMIEVSIEVGKMRLALVPKASRMSVVKPADLRTLQGLDRFEWSVAHLMLLSCVGERRNLDALLEANSSRPATPSAYCTLQGGLTFFMRGAWAAARLGRAAIPKYKRALAETRHWPEIPDAGLGLGAIALRHAGTAAEIRRILSSYEDPPPTSEFDIDLYRGWTAHAVLRMLDAAAEREKAALDIGRKLCVAFGEPLAEGHALRFAQPEDVPEALARTAALSLDADTWDAQLRDWSFVVLPLAARASAEDFYFPREVVRAWYGEWKPEEAVERITRLTRNDPKAEPVRAAPTPGRNDPCTCGSGKKWKKCHGRGATS